MKSCVLLLCAFAYLRPQPLDFFHPMQRFWRIVSMVALIYFCFVIIMMHHRMHYARWLLGYFDERLNVQIKKEQYTYDDNCELEWANLWDNFDHYYAVHLGNWFLSSFVIRNFWLLHFKQIVDEFIELSWQHKFHHFRECWWDHVFCDVLLSNVPAICIGLWTIDKLGLMRYDFFGAEGKKSVWDWEVFKCHKRFGIICYMHVLLFMHFLNGFFINNNLLIPPLHPFPVIRLLIWFGLGSIGYREAYEDAITWNTPQRRVTPVYGRYRWLITGLLFSEAFMCWKFRHGTGHIDFDAPTPLIVWLIWIPFFAWMNIHWLYLRFKPGHTTKYPVELSNANKVKSS